MTHAYAHGMVEVARGMLVDELTPADVDEQLSRASTMVRDIEAERDALLDALQYAVNWLDDIKGHAPLPSMVQIALDRIATDTGICPQVNEA